MNNKTTYETIIAEKLGHLPVPDMQDAIWARISAQLDTDMPENDPPAQPQPPRPRPVLPIAGVVITCIILYFLFPRPEQKEAIQPVHPPRDSTQIIIPETSPPPPAKLKPLLPEPVEPAPLPLLQVQQDTILPVIEEQDTVLLQQATPVLVQPDTVVPKKKGVKGLTDDDYRIAPVKKRKGQ